MHQENVFNKRNGLTRRVLLGSIGLSAAALAGGAPSNSVYANEQDAGTDEAKGSAGPYAFIDGTGPGWVELSEQNFAKVNSADDTWTWKEGVLYCTGRPISVLRTVKLYTNFEIVLEWNHRKPAGNSGLFVWADKGRIEQMTKAAKPGLPDGIEVQILDTAYADAMQKQNPNADTGWFTSHGDVFPVRTKMTPFPPLSPDGSRSFPSEDRVKPSGEWNHYYVRGINGEIRLWVNGKEVSGGNQCDPKTGYLCLESEGSPIEFRNIRVRELA